MSYITDNLGIQNFYDAAIKGGFARNYQFRVKQLGNWIANKDQLLYITTASMPGRSITPIPVPFMGLAFQVPGAATYNQNAGWNVTFRCDESLQVRNILESWSFGTFNDISSKGSNVPDKTSDHIIELVSVDNLGNVVKGLVLYGAWVVNIGDLQYDITGNGQVVNISATIAYQYWRNSSYLVDRVGPQSSEPVSPGDNNIYPPSVSGPEGQPFRSVVSPTTRNITP